MMGRSSLRPTKVEVLRIMRFDLSCYLSASCWAASSLAMHVAGEDACCLAAYQGRKIDWRGLATELPMTVWLVLSLQYPWSNWRIILLLTITGVLLVVFFLAELRAGDNSMYLSYLETVVCGSVINLGRRTLEFPI
jgi:hypothetical protein